MITIARVSRDPASGAVCSVYKTTFQDKEAVCRFFAGQVPSIRPAIVDEIMVNPVSAFETEGMVFKNNMAYTGTVLYVVIVS